MANYLNILSSVSHLIPGAEYEGSLAGYGLAIWNAPDLPQRLLSLSGLIGVLAPYSGGIEGAYAIGITLHLREALRRNTPAQERAWHAAKAAANVFLLVNSR